MFHIYLALIHKIQQALDILELAVTHHNNRFFLHTAIGQDRIKVGAARTQHHTMCLQSLSFASNGHIAKTATIEQLCKHVLQITVVELPAQAILLGCHDECGLEAGIFVE